jgi:hypothetical protein
MRALFQLLETVSSSASTILVTGRDRHGQGNRRPRDSPQQPSPRAAVRGAELRRDT